MQASRSYRPYRHTYRPGRRGVIILSSRYKPAPDNRMGWIVLSSAVLCMAAVIVRGIVG